MVAEPKIKGNMIKMARRPPSNAVLFVIQDNLIINALIAIFCPETSESEKLMETFHKHKVVVIRVCFEPGPDVKNVTLTSL